MKHYRYQSQEDGYCLSKEEWCYLWSLEDDYLGPNWTHEDSWEVYFDERLNNKSFISIEDEQHSCNRYKGQTIQQIEEEMIHYFEKIEGMKKISK